MSIAGVEIALGYAAMAGFSTSVDVNARWADRVGAYSELASAATRANAPGNDVFESGVVTPCGHRPRSRSKDKHAVTRALSPAKLLSRSPGAEPR